MQSLLLYTVLHHCPRRRRHEQHTRFVDVSHCIRTCDELCWRQRRTNASSSARRDAPLRRAAVTHGSSPLQPWRPVSDVNAVGAQRQPAGSGARVGAANKHGDLRQPEPQGGATVVQQWRHVEQLLGDQQRAAGVAAADVPRGAAAHQATDRLPPSILARSVRSRCMQW